MPLELYIALRNLSARRWPRFPSLITFIVAGGIALGVAALIVAVGTMSGMQKAVRDGILGTNPHIMVLTYGDELRFEDWRSSLDIVRRDPEVTLAVPFVYTESLVFKRTGYQQGLALRGVTSEATSLLADQLVAGSWDFDSGQSGLPGIVLGFRLARRLIVMPGDTVSLISAQNMELTPAGFIPKFEKFEVVGLFRSGMFEYDNQMGYISMAAAQDLVGLGDAVTALALYLKDPWRAETVARRIDDELGYPHTARNWMSMNEGLFNALKLEKRLTALGFSLIILVAAFNIVATLVMLVSDKTREIGILRSMGMTSKRILKVYMLQGLIIGVAGTLIGFGVGMACSWLIELTGLTSLPGDVYIVSHVPVTINLLDLAAIIIGSVFISFLATIYPSMRAAWLLPVEAIRHE